MTYTELQELVAEKLQLIADNEPLQANYAVKIKRGLKSVEQQLSALGIGAFYVISGIDDVYADSFADLTAAELVDTFQILEPRRSMLAAQRLGMPGRSPAERRMRRFFEAPAKPQVAHDQTVI